MHPKLTSLESCFAASPLTPIADPLLKERRIELYLKRDDLLHPVISGNKWRKLKYIVDDALSLGKNTLVSMGGAYSNHLHALAYLGKLLDLHTIAYVRGEPTPALTPTLQDCRSWGMELRFISRSDYRQLRQHRDPLAFPAEQSNEYWLPEGGAQRLALRGVLELVGEIEQPFDIICLACGTGTSLAGCIGALAGSRQAIGFAALKHADFLTRDIENLLPEPYANWHIEQHYHCGGFAKTTPELLAFMQAFELQHGIALEPVYTGKMLYGLFDMIAKGRIAEGSRIVAIHTGGLQGRRGFV